MKKVISLLVCTVLCVSMVACGQNQNPLAKRKSNKVISEKVEMYLTGTSQTGILDFYTVHNPTDYNYETESNFFIEILENGVWYTIDYGIGDSNVGPYYPAGCYYNEGFFLHKTLPSGTYRFIKKVYPEGKPYKSFFIAMEFAASDNATLLSNPVVTFSSVNDLELATKTAYYGSDDANLVSLEAYHLPCGIPENYLLYKVTAGVADIAFWYLPKESLTDEKAIPSEEERKKCFVFFSPRLRFDLQTGYDYYFRQYDGSFEMISDNAYLFPADQPEVALWEYEGEVFVLYLPFDFKTNEYKTLLPVEKHVRTLVNTFVETGS